MILALGVAAAITIGAAAIAIRYIAWAPMEMAHQTKEEAFDAANRVANGFKSVFNFTPRITVNGTTVVEQANAVIELATVQQDLYIDYTWSQTWLGSTKTVELRGVYRAKAGFDLHDTCKISIDETHIAAHLPAPKILSLEMTQCKVLRDDNGWWNSITPQDREEALDAMRAQARTKATASGILKEAKAKFRQEVTDALKGQEISTPVEIDFQGDPPSTPAPPSAGLKSLR